MGRLLDRLMGRPRPVTPDPEQVPAVEPEPVHKVESVRPGRCKCGKTAAMTQKGPGPLCSRCILMGVEG